MSENFSVTETKQEKPFVNADKMPDWFIEYSELVKLGLGLHIWTVNWKQVSIPNENNINADASCEANPETYIANIFVRPIFVVENTVEVRILIIHELIHVAMASQDRLVHDFFTGFIKTERGRECAVSQHRLVNEQLVVRMSMALVDVFDKSIELEKKNKELENEIDGI